MRHALTRVVLALVVALVMAPDARALVAEWDQAKVTAIAAELVEKTTNLRDAVRRQPPKTLGMAGRRAWFLLRDDLASITGTARRLHRAVEAGATQEESFPTYRRLIGQVRSAAGQLNRVPAMEPVKGKVYATGEVLSRLRPFYEDSPPI